jgi:hypothetical protein
MSKSVDEMLIPEVRKYVYYNQDIAFKQTASLHTIMQLDTDVLLESAHRIEKVLLSK